MAYSQFQYLDSMSQPSAGYMVNSIHNNLNIDPELKNPDSVHGTDPWTPQFGRVMNNYSKAPYQPSFGGAMYMSNDCTTLLPSALLLRQGSPSDHLSSACSSALSAHGESDYGHDNAPATPQDDFTMSPYSTQYETLGSSGQAFQLTGMAGHCVKPGDVNPYQEPYNPEFSHRGLSMSSHGSNYDMEQMNQQEQVQHIPRHMSPVALSPEIKDEIRIPEFNTSDNYPPLDSEAEENGYENASDIVPAEDEDDGDYKPRGASKRASAGSSGRGRKRSNHAQPAQPVQAQTKKIKLEPFSSASHRMGGETPSTGNKGSFYCNECSGASFKDESGLQKHIKQQHTRPFKCVFHWAGCESTFASKNEWKRHVSSQHLLLNYWLCQQDSCAKLSNSPNTPKKHHGSGRSRSSNAIQSQIHCAPVLPNGVIFNRKDLYTQHVRRMHIPPHIKKQVKQKKTIPEWEERIRVHQDEAHKLRCDLPDHMECPAKDCSAQFDGPSAWDERMEHVAKHLERAATGSEGPVNFGGDADPTLTSWATRSDVAVVKTDERGRWMLHNPLKPEKTPRTHTANHSYSDEDAECEDE